MTLEDKQKIFSQMVARLILQASSMGYEVTLGEAWRPPEMAQIYAQEGKGVADSVHCDRLAIDLNLFQGDTLLTQTVDYLPLGQWWEAQSTQSVSCCWGGRFLRVDADHFSIANNGVR